LGLSPGEVEASVWLGMMQVSPGVYEPKGKPRAVASPGEFVFAAAFFDHSHVYGQTEGLCQAGGTLKWAYDPDSARLSEFLKKFPQAKPARSWAEILEDPAVRLVTAAAVTSERSRIGEEAMQAGKDYLTDKAPFTTLEQLGQIRKTIQTTGKKYMVCYSERLMSESSWWVGELIRQGVLGRVLSMETFGPHRLNASSRPSWFFQKKKYGGILTDILSHQAEQFLTYTGSTSAAVEFARVENFAHREHPEFEDFGEAVLTGNGGAHGYCRVDWFNPDGLRTWGDGRLFLVGTQGYLECRKYVDVARGGGDRIFLVDGQGEHEISCEGKVGFPFFGKLIQDCLDRTETAMSQQHALQAAEVSLRAQALADARRKES